jgi:TolB-like protein
MQPELIALGPFMIDKRLRKLLRDGKLLPLGQRAVAILERLAAAAGMPVSKSDLMDAAWPDIHVEESNLHVQVGLLRKHMGLDPEGADWIVTEVRYGYRLKKLVTPHAASEAPPTPVAGRRDRPSIAVLPFLNLSGDAQQDYFSDGVAEEITIALSQLRWLFVIARNSSFAFKGLNVKVQQVGEELDVRYVMEGSVRRAANRLRIAAQLIETDTGTTLWAARFDGNDDDIFDLQDRVTASVVAAISPRLEAAEMERVRRKPTEDFTAYDHYLKGLTGFHRWTREGNDDALKWLYKAFETDPTFGAAYGMAARVYVQRNAGGWMEDRPREVAETERVARLAVEFGYDDALCLATAGFAYSDILGRVQDADALIERSLSLNANLSFTWLYSSWVKSALGQPELALERIARAKELNPNDPQNFSFDAAEAAALLQARRFDEAYTLAKASLRDRPDFMFYLIVGAASAYHAGYVDDAKRLVDKVRLLRPGIQLQDAIAILAMHRKQDVDLYETAYRACGL